MGGAPAVTPTLTPTLATTLSPTLTTTQTTTTALTAPTALRPAVLPALFVQAGAFADPANAERLAARLGSAYGRVFVRGDVIGGRKLYRVRIGPVPDVPEFDRIVAALEQVGVQDARLASD
jgi:rare lipoprotein A